MLARRLDEEVEQFVELYLKEKKNNRDQEVMNNLTDRGVERYSAMDEEKQEEFKVLTVKYIRIYNFLIQIYPLKNINLYKLQIFLIGLMKKLPKEDFSGKVDVDGLLTLDYYKIKQIAGEGAKGDDISFGGDVISEPLPGFTADSVSRKKEEELETLESIIERINKIFGINLSDSDRLVFEQMKEDFSDMTELRDKARANSYEEFRESFGKTEFIRGILKRKATNQMIFDKVLKDAGFKTFIINAIASELYQEFNGEIRG